MNTQSNCTKKDSLLPNLFKSKISYNLKSLLIIYSWISLNNGASLLYWCKETSRIITSKELINWPNPFKIFISEPWESIFMRLFRDFLISSLISNDKMQEEENNKEFRPKKMQGIALQKSKYKIILAIIIIIV